MKKLWITVFVLIAAVACSVGAIAAFADGTGEPSWTVNETTTEASGNTFTQKTAGTATHAVCSSKLDLASGANFVFTVNGYSVDPTVSDENVMTFTFTNASRQGIKLVAHFTNRDTSRIKGKIRWELSYLNPDFGADEATSPGEKKYGDLYTYRKISSQHSIDVQKLFGYYVVTVDDCTFAPDPAMDSYDLSECTLTVEANGAKQLSGKDVGAVSYTVIETGGKASDLIDGDWMDIGTSTLTYNQDGTMCYDDIDEPYSADNAGIKEEALFLRNIILNVSGYSVDERIDIAVHYDTSATPAVWWGAMFACRPFQNVTSEGYTVHEITANKGIMFQTTTGLAEAFFSSAAADKKAYSDNGGGKGYVNEKMLNTISLEIGDETSTVYWNDKPLFENYPMKKSDFPQGKVYPYFRFIESPPGPTKTNTITIKGINTPVVESTTQKRLLSETEPQVLTVDSRNNGDIVVTTADRTPLESSLYRYDSEEKKLTISAEAFADITEDCSRVYLVGNKGGYQAVTFLFAQEFAALEAPVFSSKGFGMTVGSATENLVITADLRNGEWNGFRGAGLTSALFDYTVNNDNIATVTIDKEFLNNKSAGRYSITLTTESVDKTEKQTATFVIAVVNAGDPIPDDFDAPIDPPGSETKPGVKGCGCGSRAGAASAVGAAALFGAAGIALSVRRRKSTC